MLYPSVAIAALSATGALAAPFGVHSYSADSMVTVQIANSSTSVATKLMGGVRDVKAARNEQGPFWDRVTIVVGEDVQPQNLRCQVLDGAGEPIVATRGENVDTSFADGDKGEWTFNNGKQEVSDIICDPAIQAQPQGQAASPTTPDDASASPVSGAVGSNEENIRVTLLGDSELAIQKQFAEGNLPQTQDGSADTFDQVTLTLDETVQNQELRCKIQDENGNSIKLKRGQNEEFAFSKGNPWTFLDPQEASVSKIICDPAFKKGDGA